MLISLGKERQLVPSAALANNCYAACLGAWALLSLQITAHGLVICLSTSEQKHRCRRKRILSATAENYHVKYSLPVAAHCPGRREGVKPSVWGRCFLGEDNFSPAASILARYFTRTLGVALQEGNEHPSRNFVMVFLPELGEVTWK